MAGRKVAVVGTGLIGRAWAVTFARGGCRVALFDPAPGVAAEAHAWAARTLQELEVHELLGDQTAAEVAARLAEASGLAEALDGVIYVQESAPEILEVKKDLTARIAALAAPDAVLASSTSGFVPSSYTEEVPGRHRCLVAHPINPPYLLPAVELVPAPWTDPAVVERARDLLGAIGQVPVALRKECEGFVLNRLQSAFLHEAFRLVAEGIVSAGDLDRAVAGGLGPRWSFMGPFETIDLNAPGGIRQYVERYGPLYARLAEAQMQPCDWASVLAAGLEAERTAALPRDAIEARQAWRDRRLMALAAHREEAAATLGD